MNKSNSQFLPENSTFQWIILGQAYLEEATTLVISAFMTMNPVWKHSVKDVAQVQLKIKQTVKASITNRIAFGIILRPINRLASAVIYSDLFYFKQTLNKDENASKNKQKLTGFQQIGKFRKQLQIELLQQQCGGKGQIGYGQYLAVNPQFNKYKLGNLAQALGLRHMKNQGYRKIFGITNNPVSAKINQALGAKIAAKKIHQPTKIDFILSYLQLKQDQKLNKYLQKYQGKSLDQLIREQSKQLIKKSKL